MNPCNEINESTDFFDILFYPEKADQLHEKQGVTIKGKTEELGQAVACWQTAMRSEAPEGRSYNGHHFRFTAVKNENNGVRAIIHASGGKAQLQVFKNTIHLTKIKGGTSEHILQLAKDLLIPLTKAVAAAALSDQQEQLLGLSTTGEAKCMQCGKGFPSRYELIDHIDEEHTELNDGELSSGELIGQSKDEQLPQRSPVSQSSKRKRRLSDSMDGRVFSDMSYSMKVQSDQLSTLSDQVEMHKQRAMASDTANTRHLQRITDLEDRTLELSEMLVEVEEISKQKSEQINDLEQTVKQEREQVSELKQIIKKLEASITRLENQEILNAQQFDDLRASGRPQDAEMIQNLTIKYNAASQRIVEVLEQKATKEQQLYDEMTAMTRNYEGALERIAAGKIPRELSLQSELEEAEPMEVEQDEPATGTPESELHHSQAPGQEQGQAGAQPCQTHDDETTEDWTGSVFNAPPNAALAYCVSADLHMGAGIAKQFSTRWPRIREGYTSHQSPGSVYTYMT